jgi:2,3-bisphosphoglycerate-dependent phosphoglycerate mutase
MELVFETHSLSEDNDRGVATGWLPGRLSERGRALAQGLGERRRDEGFVAVVSSDLRRAVETVELAFGRETGSVPILLDWRLRECDYGRLNGHPAEKVHAAVTGLDERFPGGESWREAMARVDRALDDIERRWGTASGPVLVVGHMATYWALQHRYGGMPLDAFGRGFVWQEGWRFEAGLEKGVDGAPFDS